MKSAFFYMAAATLLLSGYFAAGQVNQKLNIEKVTVFLKGAELKSSAKLNLSKGENEILFSNVAGDINDKSIVVNTTNGVVVESVTFQNNFWGLNSSSPECRDISDSIYSLSRLKGKINNKIALYDQELDILKENKNVSGTNTGLSVTVLQQLLEFTYKKMPEYLDARTRLRDTLKDIEGRLTMLQNQLKEQGEIDTKQAGQLMVKFYAKEASSTNVVITYVTYNAGWSPVYDIFCADLQSSINLSYKANVYQKSGVDWTKVHLILSTGNPGEGMEAPVLSPSYLSIIRHLKKQKVKFDAGVSTPDIVADNADSFDFSGISLDTTKAMDACYTMDQHVTTDNGGVNTTFDIDLPYTIQCTGKEFVVAVKNYKPSTSYQYSTTPKLDNDAFLIAKITNWEDLNLLPGPTNIFYEGTYVGHGDINTSNTKDTLNLSLGRDKKIVVERKRDTKLRSVKLIGSNVRETFGYNITVRNTRKDEITIVVQDQLPISTDKDIVIEDKETGTADYNEVTGIMTWTLTLKPNETKTLPFGYTVKYPKGKQVEGLN